MNTKQIETTAAAPEAPQRHIDYQVYPPSATSDGKGWAVTIGGEYVKVAPFETRADAEEYAKAEVLRKRAAAAKPAHTPGPSPEAIASDKAALAHYKATHAAALPDEEEQNQGLQFALNKMRQNIVPDLSMCLIAESYDRLLKERDKFRDMFQAAQRDFEYERVALEQMAARFNKTIRQRDELLAACKAWERAREDGGISHADLYEAAWQKTRAAIAAATGENK